MKLPEPSKLVLAAKLALSALRYHVEQTRPIESTTQAIETLEAELTREAMLAPCRAAQVADMKDQAIAALIEANDRARSMGFLNGTTNWAGVLATAVAAQPDCRTCKSYYTKDYMGSVKCCDHGACANGDKYQEAERVVLWGTE